ncbi:uncharacterized protein [Oscarella lobularis]|uniref:uncharacterized protein n=1 Tax=Oscarella lobularis TaxID=121494 RepID=UPI0033133217
MAAMESAPPTLVRDLSPSVLDALCGVLDTSQREQNWMALAMRTGIYDQIAIKQFELELVRPHGSPSRHLIQDFGTRNYTVDVLYRYLAEIGQGTAMEKIRHYVSSSLVDQIKPRGGTLIYPSFESHSPIDSSSPSPPSSLNLTTKTTTPKQSSDDATPSEAKSPLVMTPPTSNPPILPSPRFPATGTVTEFSYQSLFDATDGFTDNLYQSVPEMTCGRVGSPGRFGTVYKGVLKHQMCPVAIKKLATDNDSLFPKLGDRGKDKFFSEVQALSKYRHQNLVILMGCSFDTPQLCLVYEWMKGGSLEDRLINLTRHQYRPLSAKERVKISHDIGKALLYIHTTERTPLVHCNVKCSNIFIGSDCTAKLGDFGLAQPLVAGSENSVMGTRLGTKSRCLTRDQEACFSPEYVRGSVTEKVDVYAFGIVMLQMITGQRVIDARREPEELVLYVEPVLHDNNETELISLLDSRVTASPATSWPTKNLVRYARLAKQCINSKRKDRPDTKKLALELEQLYAECQESGLLSYSSCP